MGYEMCYLGIQIVRSRQFKISLHNTKRSFYRAANSIFGKIGRIASEEVVIQLIKSKCTQHFYTVSQKNDNDVLCYNFNAHQPILIIFGRDIAE